MQQLTFINPDFNRRAVVTGDRVKYLTLDHGSVIVDHALVDGERETLLTNGTWRLESVKTVEAEKVVRTSRFKHEDYTILAEEVLREIARAKRKHPGDFASAHEAFGVLKEEVDELWADVMSDNFDGVHAEAIQVAAMAIRVAVEIGARNTKTLAAA